MADSLTLLADQTNNGRRTAVLRTDEGICSLRATVVYSHEERLLLIRAWLRERYAYVVLDDNGCIAAMSADETHERAYALITEDLARRGITLDLEPEPYSLMADHVQNGRRTSVLSDADGQVSVRSKYIADEETFLLHVRVGLAELGFVHLGIDEFGGVVSVVTGRTDSDAWDRFRGELERRGYDLT